MNFGKLFIIGFEGTELNPELEAKLKELDPAGIIFYDTNIESKEQVKKLIQDLKSLLGDDLIISVDQEGGKVQRLRKITTSLPSLQALGRASINMGKEQDLLFAREPLIEHSRVLASELAELGFNMVFAPCADLSTNPLNPIIGTRSLGDNPNIVSEQLKVINDIYREYGLLTCAKHFPGHGDTSVDSHLELPVQRFTLDEYLEHLKPFIALIDSGVDAVMMAHMISQVDHKSKLEVIEYALDADEVEDPKELGLKEMRIKKEIPASISPRLIQEELRKSLGFKGLVISDEITMKALSKYGTYPELCKKMIAAGENLIIWNINIDDAVQAAQYLNAQDKEKNKALFSAYQASLELVEDHRDTLANTSISCQVYKSDLGKIVEAAISWNKPKEQIKEIFSLGEEDISKSKDTALLVFKHPKLELDMIKEVFKLDSFSFDGSEDLDLTAYKNLIILSFQTINNKDQEEYILKLRDQDFNIVQVSCDMPDKGAEVDLYGANYIHLANFLS